MTIRTTTRTALIAGLMAASLTACGSGGDDDSDGFADQSVEEIKDQVLADMEDASSLTLAGTFTNDGTETDLELSADTDGNCIGSISMGEGTGEFLRTGEATFMKGDEAFWRATAGGNADAVLSLIGDKWAKLPAGQDQLAEFCDLDNFLEELEDDGDGGAGEKGEETEIDGQEALEIVSEEDGETTHVWVATEDKHYILKLQSEGPEAAEFTLSNYDEPVEAEAPAEGEYVDLGQAG